MKMMNIEINYRAIKWDNYQGASGMPYTGRMVISVSAEDTLEGAKGEAYSQLNTLGRETFTGEVELINIVLL